MGAPGRPAEPRRSTRLLVFFDVQKYFKWVFGFIVLKPLAPPGNLWCHAMSCIGKTASPIGFGLCHLARSSGPW